MLTFVVHKLGDTVLFRCTGRLVRGEGEHLQDSIVAQPHARAIMLDLAEIDRIDAAGLGVLLAVRAWSEARNVSFRLMNLTPKVEELIELTNLRSAFEICSVSEMLELLCRAINQPSCGFDSFRAHHFLARAVGLRNAIAK